MYRIPTLLVFALLLAFPPAARAEWQLFPALYQVGDVASDDVLNVRDGPAATFAIIGALRPGQQDIEVVKTTPDARWGLVNIGERSGWISMRYMGRYPDQGGNDLPRPLACYGTEPFWSLEFSLRGNDFREAGGLPLIIPSDWEGTPEGMLATAYGVTMHRDTAAINAVISRNMCNDGMSDRDFGFAIHAILSGSLGNRLLSGCCSLETGN
jgi:uncharacterized membrane protein